MEKDIRICQCCNKEVERKDMEFTRDCHGLTFRPVCFDCYEKLIAQAYYGQYYTEAYDRYINASKITYQNAI